MTEFIRYKFNFDYEGKNVNGYVTLAAVNIDDGTYTPEKVWEAYKFKMKREGYDIEKIANMTESNERFFQPEEIIKENYEEIK